MESTFLKTAIKAATAGGDVIKKYYQQILNGELALEKKTVGSESMGLVTTADVESEQVIVDTIKQQFPDHAFLGEETHSDDINSEHLWIIDPLDGTNNFAHGIPHFAVSIAYYQNGIAKSGAIFNPISADLYTSEAGNGAHFGNRPAKVNAHQHLNETMIAVGFYYDRGEMMRSTLAAIEKLFQQDVHGIRRMGTAALDLVQVGLGRFGGYFEYTLSPWDFAAARLFVEESGGRVTTCKGQPVLLEKTSILASNGILHPQLLEIVQQHYPVAKLHE